MSEDKPLVNRIAASGLITLKPEDFWPKEDIICFDIKDYLFKGLILREKEYRTALEHFNWKDIQDKVLCVFCSSDAIIPVWAYMLVARYASGKAKDIFQGSPEEYIKSHYSRIIRDLDLGEYQDKRIVIKGCGDKNVPESAYLDLTARLLTVAKSIMYGEPCSTVPVYKKSRS